MAATLVLIFLEPPSEEASQIFVSQTASRFRTGTSQHITNPPAGSKLGHPNTLFTNPLASSKLGHPNILVMQTCERKYAGQEITSSVVHFANAIRRTLKELRIRFLEKSLGVPDESKRTLTAFKGSRGRGFAELWLHLFGSVAVPLGAQSHSRSDLAPTVIGCEGKRERNREGKPLILKQQAARVDGIDQNDIKFKLWKSFVVSRARIMTTRLCTTLDGKGISEVEEELVQVCRATEASPVRGDVYAAPS
ncbi:hypothetical protein B0H11DRAFT_1932124 [Mycena galericulata]|nr:hypothetical protein B0H11DRAFT_1932124 [Mycena galericulata]